MARIAAALLATALAFAGHAAAQGLFETDPNKIIAGWHKEKLQELRSRDAKVRADAARWLGGRDEPETLAALAEALKDPEARVRLEAASALWRNDRKAEIVRGPLAAALEDGDPNVVTQAAGALQALGMKEEELAPARKAALASPQSTPHSKYLLARNLVAFEDPLVLLPHLLGYLERSAASRSSDASRNVEAAQRSLARLVEKAREPVLVAPMRDAVRTLKAGNAVALKLVAKIEPKPAGHLEFTTSFLDSRDAAMRRAALEVLRDSRDEASATKWGPRVAALVRDPDDEVRWQAVATLAAAGAPAAAHADVLVAALADAKPAVRRHAADALGGLVDKFKPIVAADRERVSAQARPALAALAERDADADVRRAAAAALKQMEDGAAVVAAAAVQPTGDEARGMAVLRARRIAFDPDMYQRALYEGDVEAVRAFLDAGMSPKAAFARGGSPLWVLLFHPGACHVKARPTRAETKAVARLLIERGADPNVADAHGNVPLMAAASNGCDRELFGLLLAAGAKVDAKNASGLTPFEMGLYNAHDGLEELLAAGYRLPPARLKELREAYADRPATQAMLMKASGSAPAPAAPARRK